MMRRTKARCHDCGVSEGEVHMYGCDMEVCPFCGGQLLSCGCSDKYDTRGRYPSHDEAWLAALEAEGPISYIEYPVLCAKCGAKNPDFFNVPDDEWKLYIQPNMRGKVICRKCYHYIKAVTDEAEKRKR